MERFSQKKLRLHFRGITIVATRITRSNDVGFNVSSVVLHVLFEWAADSFADMADVQFVWA